MTVFELTQLPDVWQEKWQAAGYHAPSLIQEKTFGPLKDGASVNRFLLLPFRHTYDIVRESRTQFGFGFL